MQLNDYIGEATAYDKKLMLERKDPVSWLKSVSAFANTQGGRLLFGVADDGALVGLADAKGDSEFISETIKMQMDPVPEINLSIHEEGGKRFVAVEIKAGSETPYYTFVKGHRDAYIRIGNESVKATAIELKRLVLKGARLSWDGLPTEYRRDEFAFEVLRAEYHRTLKLTLRDVDLESFGLVSSGGFLTNAGALLADNSPIRHSRVFCTRWNGVSKTNGLMEAFDDAEYSGGLIGLLNSAKHFVAVNSKKMWRKTDDRRVDFPEYPERAYEECIVNGLIHRDYCEIGSEVHIDMFDDRLEISSPGGMPSGDLVQQLDWMNVTSVRRNPVIADLFQRLDLMERRGSGFKKVLDAYAFESEKRGVSIKPEFRSARSSFFAVLPNLNYGLSIGQAAGHVAVQAADHVSDHVTGYVDDGSNLVLQEAASNIPGNAARLVRILKSDMDIHEIMKRIKLSSRGHLRKTALIPAVEAGLVEMAQPDSPRSPTQKYRLTAKGRELFAYYTGIGTDAMSDGTQSSRSAAITNTITKTISKTSTETISKQAEKILNVLAGDGHISAQQLAHILGLSVPGIRYHLNLLTRKSLIKRVGSSKAGHWEVVK